MSDKMKQPWFRFHLLTLVLMVALFGTLIGANIHGETSMLYRIGGNDAGSVCTNGEYFEGYGWPWVVYLRHVDPTVKQLIDSEERPVPEHISMKCCGNIAVSVILVFALCIVSECLIHRRKARKI